MSCCFFFNDTATTEIYTLSLHDALPIYLSGRKVSETNLGHFGVGRHVVNWSGLDARGRQVGTGVYVVRLVGQELDATRKVSIIR